MKRILCLFTWAIIAFFGGISSLKAQNPTMDAQWTVISNNGSQLVLELGIRTNTSGEHLGPAQFIFLYDNTSYVKFNGGNTGAGTNGTDYNWIGGFDPAVYASNGYVTGYAPSSSVSQPTLGEIIIELDFSGAPGTAISSTSSYTPVVDIVFSVSDPTQSTTITWQMSESSPPTFDAVEDDGYNPFDENVGYFNGIVVNPLPVSLLDFTAELKNSVTTLSWKTASEINNDYFTVERSADGSNFRPILQVKGSGTCETRKEYAAYDEAPLPGVSYYRLKQTDFNSVSKTFNIVSINNAGVGTVISISGISTSSALPVMSYSLPKDGSLTIMVTDINGKLIQKEQVPGKEGANTYIFTDAATWKPGIYSVSLYSGDQFASTKMFMP